MHTPLEALTLPDPLPDDFWDDFERFLFVDEGMAPSTVDKKLRYLRNLINEEDLSVLRFLDSPDGALEEGRRVLTQVRKERTVNAYNHCAKVLNNLNDYAGHPLHFDLLKQSRVQPKTLQDWEVDQLKTYAHDDRHTHLRNRALLYWALKSGMRRGEIQAMRLDDLDPEGSTFLVREPMKHGMRRRLPIESRVWSPKHSVGAWIRARREEFGTDHDYLWVGVENRWPP